MDPYMFIHIFDNTATPSCKFHDGVAWYLSDIFDAHLIAPH